MEGWDHLPFLIAHRGASASAPENTLAAFEHALQAGAEVLEPESLRREVQTELEAAAKRYSQKKPTRAKKPAPRTQPRA